MAKILVIDSSVRFNSSTSRELTGILADRIKGDANEVIHRDLTRGIHFISEQSLNSVEKLLEERTVEENELAALSDSLIEELELADYLIIGAPMYNFGPPASLKAWADLVARVKRTFEYTDNGPVGLLRNKKAFVVVVTGGTGVNSNIDFMTPWLRHFLAFIGITNVEIISADGVYGNDGEEKIKFAKEKIGSLII
ncbi:FMN-dependent NADH-azoreductase [Sulfuriflexus mobilis]|uniref:FMN-dependent NADH-azoreductase n=1 Tax=Sulfuriflexus mobilis TaxID=1811807 RepID=UPI000F827516|nr:NAD(P)H-dependent oxidoreductase [Sulfuriflexus mobilis]